MRLLKKYDYPPKQARHAIEIVMRQTELMSENIAYEKAMDTRFKDCMVAEDSVDYEF